MGITETGCENLGAVSWNRPLSWQRAIFTHAHDLAGVIIAMRDSFRHVVIGDSHIKHAIAAEVDACGQMSTGFAPILGHEDILNIRQLISLQLAARDRLRRSLFSRLVVGEIDEMVLRELRMKDDVHQTAATRGILHRRDAADGLRVELAVANQTHVSIELVYENASIR